MQKYVVCPCVRVSVRSEPVSDRTDGPVLCPLPPLNYVLANSKIIVKERKSKVNVKLPQLKRNRISFWMFDKTKEIWFSVNIRTHKLLLHKHTYTYKHAPRQKHRKNTIDVKQQTNEQTK